jgi:hypothetical protein
MDPNSYDKDLTASQVGLTKFLTAFSRICAGIRLTLRLGGRLTAQREEEQEYGSRPKLQKQTV